MVNILQGIVDGYASKPAFRQDTGYMVEKTYHETIFAGFWGIFKASGTHIWFKMCFHIQKQSLECGGQLTLSSIWSKKNSFGQKQPQQNIWLRKVTIYLNI